MTTGFTPRMFKGWWANKHAGLVAHRLRSRPDTGSLSTLCGGLWSRTEILPFNSDHDHLCRRCLSLEARWLPESEDTP